MYSIALFVFFGFLLSVTQAFGYSYDYLSYDEFIDLARSKGSDVLFISRFEPGFSIFTIFLTTFITSNIVIYSWIVVAAMTLKGWAISFYSSNQRIFLLVTIFYLARYFPPHELTQLRAACAIALILVGAIILWEGNWFLGIFICMLALLFHFSTLAIIPSLFLPYSKRWQVVLTGFLVFMLASSGAIFFTDYFTDSIPVL